MLMGEKRIRSIAKGISWRILATITTVTLVFLFTGNLALSMSIGVLDIIIKFTLYYLHERAWVMVNWGMVSSK